MNCFICASPKIKQAFSKQGKDFFRCGVCGFIFIEPYPTHISYGKEHCDIWEKEEVRVVKRETFRRWLDKIQRYVSVPGKVLDLGCATGLFLEEARGRGWDVFGIEISAYSAGIAAEKFPSRVTVGSLQKIDFDACTFDCVTLFDLIDT